MSPIIHDLPAELSPAEQSGQPENAEQQVRQLAINQIERRRRFKLSTAAFTLAMLILTAIWAVTEYNNAGGWPTSGFSQSSGIHDVWNIWIMYPWMAWVFLTGVGAWSVYVHRPISERDIQREIDRQSGTH